MAVLREQPYSNFNFLVDLGTGETQGPDAGFAEIDLPDARFDIYEYRNGNERENSPRLINGLVHYGNVTLKRGVIGSLTIYQWFEQVRNGDQDSKRNVIIQLQNEEHSEVVMTWKLIRARPARFKFSKLDANGRNVAFEYLELAFERLEME